MFLVAVNANSQVKISLLFKYYDIGLGDDQPLEIKKPRRVPIFDFGGLVGNRILKIACGGMHTVALSNQGKVFTWGCNDEGALGRPGAENTPLEVANTLLIPVTDISAGDCHSVAYNQSLNQVYLWGLYRVSIDRF